MRSGFMDAAFSTEGIRGIAFGTRCAYAATFERIGSVCSSSTEIMRSGSTSPSTISSIDME